MIFSAFAAFHVTNCDVSRLGSLPGAVWVYSHILIGAITKRRWLEKDVTKIDSHQVLD